MTPSRPTDIGVDIQALVTAVQTNCHIADARHAADLPLCIYLLQMREFYRWEQGLPLGAPLGRDAVGQWLAAREDTWTALENHPFSALPAPPTTCPSTTADRSVLPVDPADAFDAFDVAPLNAHLMPRGFVYGAGLAGPDRPGFFLADLTALEPCEDGLVVQVCGREHARSLFAPPAALQGDTIVLRRESLARWLWEKYETFSLRRADGPFKAVVDAYHLDDDFGAALPHLLDEQSRTLILHELGEHRAGLSLGPQWAAMRLALPDRRTDLFVRAVRDQLADLETTLPTLLQRDATASIHFWFAAYDGVRQALYPSLPMAYDAWRLGDGGQALQRAITRGQAHFRQLAEAVLALHGQHSDAAGPMIQRLLTAPEAVCH